MERDHSTECSANENEDFDKTNTDLFNNMNKEQPVLYDNEFIKKNFYPLKFSKIDIKNLSSDFADQTLGGHREYREEIIDGRLAKVYIYKVKVIKYDDEYISVEKKSTGAVHTPLVIIENNLIMPCNTSLVQNRNIPFTSNLPQFSVDGENSRIYKRGRPRKYPVGEEPYKRRRATDNYHEVVPKVERRPKQSEYGMDYLDFDYNNIRRSASPRSNEYFDFSNFGESAKSKDEYDDKDHFDFDEYLRKLSPPKDDNKNDDSKKDKKNLFKIDDYIK